MRNKIADEASKEPSRLSQAQGLGARRGLVNNRFKGSRSPRLVALRNLRINTTKGRVSKARKSPPHVINTSGGCKGKLEGGSDKRRTLQRHIITDSLVVSCTWKSQGVRGVNARTAKAIIDSSSSAGSRRRGSTKPAIVHGVASPTSQKSGDGVLKSLVLEIPKEDETETCGTNTPKDIVQQRQRPGAIARKAIEGNKRNLAEAFMMTNLNQATCTAVCVSAPNWQGCIGTVETMAVRARPSSAEETLTKRPLRCQKC